ncbi:MAG: hypothetical protein R2867_09640 [Caldilineaceae bacterium]
MPSLHLPTVRRSSLEVADDTDLTETYIGDLAMMLEEFEQANDAYQKALAVAREDDEVDQRIVRAKIREVAFVQNVNSAEAELATYQCSRGSIRKTKRQL